jgi:hypothetical protein
MFKMAVFWDAAPCGLVQWTQNNSELQQRRSKRGREDGMDKGGGGGKTVKSLSIYSENENIFPFLILTQSVAF